MLLERCCGQVQAAGSQRVVSRAAREQNLVWNLTRDFPWSLGCSCFGWQDLSACDGIGSGADRWQLRVEWTCLLSQVGRGRGRRQRAAGEASWDLT